MKKNIGVSIHTKPIDVLIEASWELKFHLQNAYLILEDYLHHVGAEDRRQWQTRRKFDGGSGEYEATRAFVAEGPMLVECLCMGGDCI